MPATLDGARVRRDRALRGAGVADDDEPEFWDLYIGELRLGRHRDGVADKRHAYVFDLRERCRRPPLPAVLHHAQPPLHPDGPGAGPHGPAPPPPPAPARRRIVAAARAGDPPARPRARRARRCAAGPGAREPKVTILIANAYAMGGTVRTDAQRRGLPGARRPRGRDHQRPARSSDRPFFPFPTGVKVRVVDDQRDRPLGGLDGPAARAPAPAPQPARCSPATSASRSGSTLWTDLLLLRRLWAAATAS